MSIQHFRHARSGHLDEKAETVTPMPSSIPAATYTQQPYAQQPYHAAQHQQHHPQRPGVVAGGAPQWRSNSDLEKQGVYAAQPQGPRQPARSYHH